MAEAILDTPFSVVNSIEICRNSINQTEISIDDLYDSIKILVKYIITKNKGRRNMKNMHSIEIRQQSAFDAAVENTKQANEAIKSAQNWLNILAIAELTLLSSFLIQDYGLSNQLLVVAKVMIVLLVASLLMFLLGALTQFRHLLSIARTFSMISDRAYSYMKEGKNAVDILPKDLDFPDHMQLKSNKLTNLLFAASFLLVVLVSIGISALIFFI